MVERNEIAVDSISFNKSNNKDFGIKNYFLEAQKKAAALGQNVKKKMPPLFENYFNNNSGHLSAQWHPGVSQGTASATNP